MTETEKLAIEWQCQKLCRQFANYNDQNDFKALCDLFTADGSFWRPSDPDTEIKGRETIYADKLLLVYTAGVTINRCVPASKFSL